MKLPLTEIEPVIVEPDEGIPPLDLDSEEEKDLKVFKSPDPELEPLGPKYQNPKVSHLP